MSVHRANGLWHNAILRYHLVRGLAIWIVMEIGAAVVAHSSQKQMNSLLEFTRREHISVHVPEISVPVVDAGVAILAAVVYTRIALRRAEDRILLGNLGISGKRLSAMIGMTGLLLAACTWGLR